MVLSGIRPSFPSLSRSTGQITHVLLTRSPLEHPHQGGGLSVRLACVKHAASVRPEPGSNSPKKQTKNYRQKTKKSTKQQQTTNTINNYLVPTFMFMFKQTKFASSNDTLSSSQTTPPPTTQHPRCRAANSDHTNIQTPPQNHKPPPHNNKNREKLYKVC